MSGDLGRRIKVGWLCWLLATAWLAPAPAAAQADEPRRVAVVVGANQAAPGRSPLRFSHDDAKAFAEVLRDVAGVDRQDVTVLLDPDPQDVLAALDAKLALLRGQAGMLVFYYSGHADAASLYPRGRPLPLSALRKRLSDERATVRIGLIDACRGGGWTGAKGLSETDAFAVEAPMNLNSEGSVLIASSSGLEDAHESEALGGSFFTHHWNAALRGASDRNGDGQITVGEAFDYAKAHTVRDSILQTSNAQHPSFSLQLRGRQDLPLAQVSAGEAVLSLAQDKGPLELVHLGTGLSVLEVPAGKRTVRLAIPPGRYLVRRRQHGKVWALELSIRSGQQLTLEEANLSLVGSELLAIKHPAPRPLTLSTLPAHTNEITFGLGVNHGNMVGGNGMSLSEGESSVELAFSAPWAITDRWQWAIPSLALVYRGGEHGAVEWLPWAGLPSWMLGLASTEGVVFLGKPAFGLDLRQWLNTRTSVDFGVRARSEMSWWQHRLVALNDEVVTRDSVFEPPNTWRLTASVGYTATLADTVTLHLALSLEETVLYEGKLASFGLRDARSDLGLAFGSVQDIGLRRQPLLRIHLTDHVALNIDAAVSHRFGTKKTREAYMAGASFFF